MRAPFICVLLCVISLLLPHPPNVTPVIAGVAWMARQRGWGAAWMVLVLLCVACLVSPAGTMGIGLAITYGSLLCLVIVLGVGRMFANRSPCWTAGAAALLFFVVSNFFCWVTMPCYEKSWTGFADCYISAWPFFTHQLLATAVSYSFFCWQSKSFKVMLDANWRLKYRLKKGTLCKES